jgi:type IX secretion system PorP/SprF family membrane protein
MLLAILGYASFAQDVHFTQWMHAPHTYSPSSVGDFNGDYRFHGNYRNQWSSVTVPFKTFAGMIEANIIDKYVRGASIAAGMTYDVTGDSKFSTTHLNVGLGYQISLPDSIGIFRIGVIPNATQKKIDVNALKFDNQYNGYYFDGNLSSGEFLPRLSRWYFDFGLGLEFSKYINNKFKFRSSFAVFNLLSPQQSFFNNNDIRLDRRYSFQIDGAYHIDEKFLIRPGLQFSNQGKYYSINFGGILEYDLSKTIYFKQNVFAGIYFRTIDSGDLIFGLDYGDWRIGVCYDINYSGLVPASNYKGGVELALIYIIAGESKRPKYKVCPDF